MPHTVPQDIYDAHISQLQLGIPDHPDTSDPWLHNLCDSCIGSGKVSELSNSNKVYSVDCYCCGGDGLIEIIPKPTSL